MLVPWSNQEYQDISTTKLILRQKQVKTICQSGILGSGINISTIKLKLRQKQVKTICRSGILGYGISVGKIELVLATQNMFRLSVHLECWVLE